MYAGKEDDWNPWKTTDGDGTWFLYEPAEPPFACIPSEVEIWRALEQQMWEYYVLRAVTDEVKPLFRDSSAHESD